LKQEQGAQREGRVPNPATTEQGRLFRGGEVQSRPEEHRSPPRNVCVVGGRGFQTEKTCTNTWRPRQEIDNRDRSEWVDSEAVEKVDLAGAGD